LKNLIFALCFFLRLDCSSRTYDPREQQWYLDAVANGSAWSQAFIHPDLGTMALTFSATLANLLTGEIEGVTAFDLQLEALSNALVQVNSLPYFWNTTKKIGPRIETDKKGDLRYCTE
jgi:hypothetical protein